MPEPKETPATDNKSETVAWIISVTVKKGNLPVEMIDQKNTHVILGGSFII